MKRHISFCLLTTVCQFVQLLNILQMTGYWDQPIWLQTFCAIYFVLVAYLIFLIRISEPLVLKQNKKNFYYFFCCGWYRDLKQVKFLGGSIDETRYSGKSTLSTSTSTTFLDDNAVF